MVIWCHANQPCNQLQPIPNMNGTKRCIRVVISRLPDTSIITCITFSLYPMATKTDRDLIGIMQIIKQNSYSTFDKTTRNIFLSRLWTSSRNSHDIIIMLFKNLTQFLNAKEQGQVYTYCNSIRSKHFYVAYFLNLTRHYM